MNKISSSILTFAFIVSGMAVASTAWAAGAHGGGHHGSAYGQPGKAAEATRTVHVKAGDMAFDIKELAVKPGETIRFVIENTDEVDHDFTIGPPEMQAEHRKEMMQMMNDNHDMSAMHNDPNAVYVKPGESKILVWKFADVSDLEFACNVPGHYESGMMGRFVSDGGTGSMKSGADDHGHKGGKDTH